MQRFRKSGNGTCLSFCSVAESWLIALCRREQGSITWLSRWAALLNMPPRPRTMLFLAVWLNVPIINLLPN
jgi:hypothetical protein